MKKILTVQSAPAPHWVGDGFPVRSLFSYTTRDLPLSPFLLLDYAGPAVFPADRRRRGVGEQAAVLAAGDLGQAGLEAAVQQVVGVLDRGHGCYRSR